MRSLGAAALVLLALAACDTDDGRTLEPPPPGATAPPLATSTTATTAVLGTPPVGSGESGGSASSMTLASPAFADGGPFPTANSCDGANLSVPVTWEGVPPGTVELAITMLDPDAPGEPFVHWVVTGIDPVVTGFGEGGLPESAVAVRPWTGPCPPFGETHTYVFTLFALTEPSGVVADDGVEAALGALESTPGPTATLFATYARTGS